MTPLLALLLGAALIGLVSAVATGPALSAQRGFAYSAGARDNPQPLTGIPARIQRASANFNETFAFFAVAALVAHLTGRETPLAIWGGWIYVVARLVYWPLYVAGVPVIRSLVWLAAIAGIVMVGFAAAFG